MSVVRRILTCRSQDGPVDVAIEIGPAQAGLLDWICPYRIAWPEGVQSGSGYGVDAVQALLLAMKAVGTELYTSEHHRAGRLSWEKQGAGYGFPVPTVIRNLLEGDDVAEFG